MNGTVTVKPATDTVDDVWHNPANKNRETAVLIIRHPGGLVEEHPMLSNACIKGLNNWVAHGYIYEPYTGE